MKTVSTLRRLVAALGAVVALAGATCAAAPLPTALAAGTGVRPAPAPAASTAGPAVPGTYTAVTPFRALDTRHRVGTPGTTPVPGGASVTASVSRPGGVPSSGVAAVLATVVVVDGAAPGWVTAWASGSTKPTVSTLNWTDGRPVANSAVLPVGSDGRVVLANGSSRPVHVLLDIEGWYAAGPVTATGAVQPVAPRRVLDTRHAVGTATSTPVVAGDVVAFPVAAPGTASAVWLNLTATSAVGTGWASVGVTLRGDGTLTPFPTSELSWAAGRTTSNLVLARVGPDGRATVRVAGSGTVHLVVDLEGLVTTGVLAIAGTTRTDQVDRLLDTRATGTSVAPGASVAVPIRSAGLPGDAAAATVTVTVTGTTGPGWLSSRPLATGDDTSLVLWESGRTVSVTTTVPLDDQGRAVLRNVSSRPVHLLVDLSAVVLGRDVPVAAGWTATRLALGTTTDEEPYPVSLACGDQGACATAAVLTNIQPRRYLVTRADQGRWGPTLTFVAGNDTGGLRVAPSTSCSGTGLCVATLVEVNGAGSLATSSPGGVWQVRPIPGSPASVPRIVDASCSSGGSTCRVLAREGTSSSTARAAVSSSADGVTWTSTVLPLPTGATQSVPLALECRTDDACTAIGTTDTRPAVWTWDGTAWTATAIPPGLGLASLSAVRMLPDEVLLFGTTASGPSVIHVGAADGTGWTARTTSGTGLTSLPACTLRTSACFSLVAAGTDLAGTPHGPGIARWPGLETTPLTSPDLAQPSMPLRPLACAASSCIASGNSTPRLVGQRTVVVEQAGDAWVSGLLPLPSDALETDEGTTIGGTACWATGCLALTRYVDTRRAVAIGSAVRAAG